MFVSMREHIESAALFSSPVFAIINDHILFYFLIIKITELIYKEYIS